MKARLLYQDQDMDLKSPLPWNAEALVKDLELDTLFHAMARSDDFVREVTRRVVLSGAENDVETIRYRRGVLRDCLNHPGVVRDLYAVAAEAAEHEKKIFFGNTLMRYPDWVLRRSIDLSEMFLVTIKKLRKIVELHADKFSSEGWTAFFATLQEELTDEYLVRAHDHVKQLKFRSGMLLGAGLGKGNMGTRYALHIPPRTSRGKWEWLKSFVPEWLKRLLPQRPPVLGFSLHPRDESGARALRELENRGIAGVANTLAQSTDNIRGFFDKLRSELAFYVGCVNLHEQLSRKGEPICLPLPVAVDKRRLSFRGLYDVCLALSVDRRVVGNTANADEQNVVIVTGANQGGKSTFLRSVGLAQLMMQCGMFVAAESFRSSVYGGIFTHFKREEDAAMKSGKLDEEIGRMSAIVDHLTSNSMVLFNEPFASTNEREGSEIARQILLSLSDLGVKVICVTHLYELARGLHERNTGNVLFLRADRHADGTRTFRIVEGEPLETSFGEDLYESIFGAGSDQCATTDPVVHASAPKAVTLQRGGD
ncbi:MAG: DNA mismatch repair protein MutS [Deltaproteobacteria bacterium]|nr:DNA mismatch repair protein MutS [Deltaproteobacteria bacterium]